MLTAIMNHGNHNIMNNSQKVYLGGFLPNLSSSTFVNNPFQTNLQTYQFPSNRIPLNMAYQASEIVQVCDVDSHESDTKLNLSLGELVNNRYLILEMLGSGSFGQVIKCYDQIDMEYVAVKFLLTRKQVDESKTEAYILDLISYTDYDQLFVKMKSVFMWKGSKCIVMELLGSNLFDHLRVRTALSGLPISNVQSIGYQLFKALNKLGSLGIIHCDIKPENIALTDSQSCRMKLIDFGSSCFCNNTIYKYIQSRFYRSPEVILELGYDFSIDMWSVGCVLAELYLGTPLFPANSELDQLHKFMSIIGQIPTNQILNSPKLNLFCDRLSDGSVVYKQPPKTANSSLNDNQDLQTCIMNKFFYNGRKDEICNMDFQVLASFIDLLKKIFVYDPACRIKPFQALSHPFFTFDLSMRPSSGYCAQNTPIISQQTSFPCLINCIQRSGIYQGQINTTIVPQGVTAYIPTIPATYMNVAEACPDVRSVKQDGPLVFPMLLNYPNYYQTSIQQPNLSLSCSNYDITPVGHILIPTITQCDCQKCSNLCMYN